MTVVAVSMVKDEADIVAATVAHMCGQVDAVIVADNNSTDGTRDILDGLPVTVVDDPDPAYYQSRKMTALAERARVEFDATWVIPFDADEWWYSPHGRIADVLEQHSSHIATAALYDHVATGADADLDDPVGRIGWRRRKAAPLPKIAARCAPDLVIAQGNHDATYDVPADRIDGLLVVRHFPYRSPEQMARKARNGAEAYAATDLPEDAGAHWRAYHQLMVAHGDEAIHDVFRMWFWTADPTTDPTLIYDPAP